MSGDEKLDEKYFHNAKTWGNANAVKDSTGASSATSTYLPDIAIYYRCLWYNCTTGRLPDKYTLEGLSSPKISNEEYEKICKAADALGRRSTKNAGTGIGC
jgi:hypothetical protein